MTKRKTTCMICLERVMHARLPRCGHTICHPCFIEWCDFNLIKPEQTMDTYHLDRARIPCCPQCKLIFPWSMIKQRTIDHPLLQSDLRRRYHYTNALIQSRKPQQATTVELPDLLTLTWLQQFASRCPGCDCLITKDGGCFAMQCTRCNTGFLWDGKPCLSLSVVLRPPKTPTFKRNDDEFPFFMFYLMFSLYMLGSFCYCYLLYTSCAFILSLTCIFARFPFDRDERFFSAFDRWICYVLCSACYPSTGLQTLFSLTVNLLLIYHYCSIHQISPVSNWTSAMYTQAWNVLQSIQTTTIN